MPNLKGKIAVVTGASSGIGTAIAKKLAADGASVVVNYMSNKARAEQIVEEIRESGGEAIALGGNVANQSEVTALFLNVKEKYGKIDILINNAGVAHRAALDEITEEAIHHVFSINVTGVVLATQAAIALFPPEGGSIVNISSMSVTAAYPGSAILAGSKGALEAMTRVFANELGPKHIRVNVVSPGFTITEGTQVAVPGQAERIKSVVQRTPLGRVGQSEDIAKIVSFVASVDAGWITGTIVPAAGGLR